MFYYSCPTYLKKGYSKMCAKHPSSLPLGLPSHRYLDLLPSFYLVLAQIQFTEWTLLCISSVQIHIHTAQSNSKEMSVHPYRETCFDSWRLLAFNIVRNLYCLMWSATLKIWMPVCTKEAVWTNCCEKY